MTWLFSAAILLSACLLFLVQPLCAKMLLPYLGGTPAVWNSCMVFFQAGLLLGYAYAHYVPRWLGVGRHAILHLIVLLLAYLTLPVHFPTEIPSGWDPVFWLLTTLTVQVGLPFTALAASAPLVQRWFVVRTWSSPRDPYFLYAASNLGSFIALALFPLVLEPYFSLTQIGDVWKFAFLLLTAMLAFCVPSPRLSATEQTQAPVTLPASPDRSTMLLWVILAMIPSSLLLSVTTHITTDVAPIPLLWLIPMGIYLLTFTLVFAGKPWIPQSLLTRWLPLVVIVLTIVMLSEATDPLLLVLGLHLLGLFWVAMVCHGELARTRPAPDHLTTFYLCLAIGGVLGGVLNAILAPLLFSRLTEYPLVLVLACYFGRGTPEPPTRQDAAWAIGLGSLTLLLVLALQASSLFSAEPHLLSSAAMILFSVPLLFCYMMQTQTARFALTLGAVLLASSFYHGIYGTSIYRERSYFGIHRVTKVGGFHHLVHGNTIHGKQSLDGERGSEPLTYYSRQGPIGELFQSLKGDARLQRVGLVGLGAGSLAAYSEPGHEWTFFEIDPTVVRIAKNPQHFTYLSSARGTIRIELGDARLTLQQSSDKFGVLVIDAFGSDAIPGHLLTREALQIYRNHLLPNGVLAFHISNKYVDLEPVLAATAADARPEFAGYIREDRNISPELATLGISPSVWVLLARKPEDLQPLLTNTAWRPIRSRREVKAWTDDYSNLLQVFRWSAVE